MTALPPRCVLRHAALKFFETQQAFLQKAALPARVLKSSDNFNRL